MSGPAPKHPSTRVRRNSGGGMRELPSKGREGKAPPWPLGPDAALHASKAVADMMMEEAEEALDQETDGRRRRTLTKALEKARITAKSLELQLAGSGDAELALWEELWTYPQAVQWEADRAHRSVAMYVRWQVKAENGHLEPAKEARMWSDRLGLSSMAMQRLKLEVQRVDAAEDGAARRRGSTPSAPAAAGSGKGTKGDKDDPRSGLYAVPSAG